MERIQKALARSGLASRREVERWIEDGRITVNGKLAELGDKIGKNDKVKVDGRAFKVRSEENATCRVIMYYKPEGQVCTRDDPEGRPTVFKYLPKLPKDRWISIGRLDINTSGLLLFTTDGELAHRLMHPSYEIEREYAVRVLGKVSDEVLKRLQKGVKLDDGPAHFDSIAFSGGSGANQWYHVTLREGRQREVRRLWESQDVKVSRLIRVRYGNIHLPRDLRYSRYVELEAADINKLRKSVDLAST